MHCIEISTSPELTADQATILDAHSLLNVLNVLMGEVQLIGVEVFGTFDGFAGAYRMCTLLEHAISNSLPLHEVDRALRTIAGEVQELAVTSGMNEEVARSIASIQAILPCFLLRYQEFRDKGHYEWTSIAPSRIRDEFMRVMDAMSVSAKGRYGFALSRGGGKPRDYRVNLTFNSGSEATFCMPPVLVDAVRDLFANSRKYTAPGGKIDISITQEHDALYCSVEDSGRGIPCGELAKVAEFGYRANNVADRPTKGGGFGLTKTVVNVKRYNGRIWIGSEQGVGTSVTFRVPLPHGESGTV